MRSDYQKQYYQEHKKEILDRVKKYYIANKEIILSRRRKGKLNTADELLKMGGRFGNIVILKKLDKQRKRSPVYLCKCNCGELFETTNQRIVKNKLKGRIMRCNKCADKTQRLKASKNGKKTILKASKIGWEKFGFEQTRIDKLCKTRPQKNNSTGVLGVCFKNNGYEVTIGINRKQIYIGRAKTIQEAKKMREEAVKQYHLPVIKRFKEEKKNDK